MHDTRIDFLYLSESDMIAAGVTDMRECVAAMGEVLKAMTAGDYIMGGGSGNSHGIAVNFPESSPFPNMPLNDADRRFMAMPAYLGGPFDSIGMKWYGSNVENRAMGLPRSVHLFVLSDKVTGAPLALMSANVLSAYRTGAIPGLGAMHLAREDSRELALIGPGVMNRTSLESILLARPAIDTVRVVGRGAASLEAFLKHARNAHPQLRQVTGVATIEEAVRGADVVSVAPSTAAGLPNYPYVAEEWIAPGAFVSVASTVRLDADFVTQRARNVADSKKLYEAYVDELPAPAHGIVGTLGVYWNDLIAEGRLDRTTIDDLGEMVSGAAPGRTSEDEIILFAVGGMPVEDVAWARIVYDNAVRHGIGTPLNLWESPFLA